MPACDKKRGGWRNQSAGIVESRYAPFKSKPTAKQKREQKARLAIQARREAVKNDDPLFQ